MSLAQLNKEFFHLGETRGGIFLLSQEAAVRFVKECRKLRIELLGIDGFYLTPTTIRPSMEHSVDFTLPSQPVPPEQRWDAAENFLNKHRGMGMFFEIVASDRTEESAPSEL